jgi:hypothetical protein
MTTLVLEHLQHADSASPDITIDSSGRVGIGEVNPAEKLEVSGNIKLDTGSTQYIDFKSGTSGAKNYRIYNGVGWNSDALLVYNHSDDSTILTIEPGKLGINRGANSLTQALEVYGSAWISGNVGIGETSPTRKLQVNGAANDGTELFHINSSGDVADGGYHWMSTAIAGSQSTNANIVHMIGKELASKNAGYFGFHYAGDHSNNNFITLGGYAADQLLNIKMDGNVGIGTTSPLRKLHISDAGDTHIVLQSTNAVDDSEIFEIGVGANSASKVDLTFRTRLNSGSGGTEHMRITNDGYVTTPNQPGFHASNNGTPSGSTFTSSENTILKFDNVNSNVGGGWNTSTYRYTAPITGRYMIYAQARFDGLTSYARVYVSVNGTTGWWGTGLHAISTQSPPSGGTMFTGSVQGVLPLSAGDYIELKGGSNNSVGTHQGEGSFGAYLLG